MSHMRPSSHRSMWLVLHSVSKHSPATLESIISPANLAYEVPSPTAPYISGLSGRRRKTSKTTCWNVLLPISVLRSSHNVGLGPYCTSEESCTGTSILDGLMVLLIQR